MVIDLTGGLPAEREYVFAEAPGNPEMRDSASFWILDDRGDLALPRIGIEAVAADWDNHGLQVNVALPDGRVFRLRETGASLPALDDGGRPTVLGTGPLAFRCVEPFRTWSVTFTGTADQTSAEDLLAGQVRTGPRVDLEFAVETTMAAPPWIQGSLLRDAGELLASSVEGGLMGGPRYEQLFRASGTLRVGGEEHAFTGSGLRIRRQGVRHLGAFWGHCWQSALFPGGRGFGYIAYPPRADGAPTFNEGYLFGGDGALVPSRVVEAPWLRRLQATGEDVAVVFETAAGRTRIEGETVLSTHDVFKPDMPTFPVLQQAAVRYRWDGEQTYGMLERSSERHLVEGLAVEGLAVEGLAVEGAAVEGVA